MRAQPGEDEDDDPRSDEEAGGYEPEFAVGVDASGGVGGVAVGWAGGLVGFFGIFGLGGEEGEGFWVFVFLMVVVTSWGCGRMVMGGGMVMGNG